MARVMIVILVVMATGVMAIQGVFHQILRTELGIIMQPGRVISIADTNHITQEFVLPIPRVVELPKSRSIYLRCQEQLSRAREMNNGSSIYEGTCENLRLMEGWLDSVIERLKVARVQLVRELFSTIPVRRNETERSKRGGVPILNVIGEVSYGLFGTARADDVAKNEQDIIVLQGGQRKLRNAVSSLVEIMTAEVKRLSDDLDSAMDAQQELQQRQARAYERMDMMKNKQDSMIRGINMNALAIYESSVYNAYSSVLLRTKMGYVIHLINDANSIMDITTEVRQTLNNKMSAKLISPKDLREAIENTNQYLRRTYPRFRVAFEDVTFYYRNIQVTSYQSLGKIHMRMSIPIVSEEHIFAVYQVRVFPVPVRVRDQPADGTIISNLPQEVALSRNGHYYINSPVVNWGSCKGGDIAMCPDVPHMRKVTEHGCMAAIIRNDRTAVKQTCDVEYIVKPQFPSLAISIGRARILIAGPELEGQLLCKSKPPIILPINHFSVIDLGCDCAFLTAGSWVPYSLSGCGGVVRQSNVTFVINDLLEMGVSKPIWTSAMLNGRQLNVLKVDPLPPKVRVKLERRAKFENSSASIKLKRLSNELADEEWEMEVQDMIARTVGTQSAATYGSSGIIIVILLVLGVCCCCRYRHAMAGMMMINQGPQVRGEAEWGFGDEEPPPTCIPTVLNNDTTLTIVSMLLVISLIICIYLIRKLRREKQHRLPDGMYLQIAARQVCETAHLGESTMPLDHLFQKTNGGPLIKDVNVSAICGRYSARIQWGRTLYATEMATGEEAVPLPLPQCVKISRTMAKALQGDNCVIMARLLRYTGGLASVVPTEMPMISAAGWSSVGARAMATHSLSAIEHQRAMADLENRPVNQRRLPNVPSNTGGMSMGTRVLMRDRNLSQEQGREDRGGISANPVYDDVIE